jgi:colicin import membrane protein
MTDFPQNTMPNTHPMNANQWTSLGLAGFVHLLLFAFLWVGVQWQSKVNTAVEAEVWDMTVREAAPLPVEPVIPDPVIEKKPEPVPVKEEPKVEPKEDPEIAIAQEKKRLKIEQEKIEVEREIREKREKEIELAKQKELARLAANKLKKDKELQDKIFADNMRRLNSQAVKVGTGGNGSAPKSTGNNRGDPNYANLIGSKVRSNTVYVVSDASNDNPSVEFTIQFFPDGTLRGPVKKTKSSGVLAFDDAVANAIVKSVPFPRDKSGEVPSSINYVHRMKDLK